MEFRLGSIPIKIHGSFLITALLLSGLGGDIPRMLVTAVAIVIAIILHELGHALIGKAFGLVPRIDLHGMGGTTSWPQGRKIGWGKSILISLAGPFAGFITGGIVAIIASYARMPDNELVATAISQFVTISFVWGVFNLVPMLPLDGGNVMLAALQIFTKGRGEKPARYVSIGFAAILVAYFLRGHNLWGAAICGLFLFRNVQALRQGGRVQADADLYGKLKLGYAALERKDGPAAITHAEIVLEHTTAPELRFEALRLLAYARILEGQWGPLMALVERCSLELGPSELERIEKAAEELDRPDEAKRIRELRALPAAVSGFRA